MAKYSISKGVPTGIVKITPAEANDFCVRCMKAVQTKPEHSVALADVLIAADCLGNFRYGLRQIEMYVKDVQSGFTSKSDEPKILKEKASTALVDGMDCLGPVVGNFSMNLAIKKAKETGVGYVSAKGSNNYGIAGWYSNMACQQGFLGMSFINTSPLAYRRRGKNVVLDTNPLILAAPGEKESDNFLLDMGKAKVSFQTILMRKVQTKKPIPLGLAADSNGKITTNDEEGYNSGLLTGDYKGYGMSMMVEIFCGFLSGPLYGTDSFVAIDPEAFEPGFKSRMTDLANNLRSTPKANPNRAVLIPGELEREHKLFCERVNGILYVKDIIDSMNKLAQTLEISPIKVVC